MKQNIIFIDIFFFSPSLILIDTKKSFTWEISEFVLGVLEWITESSGQVSNTSSSVLLLQKDKDRLTSEYKSQRKTVDQLKTELQSRITSHTSLAEQSNQSEAVLQDSLAEIHKLRDQLKSANEKLKELKKSAKDTQDKLRVSFLM